MNAVFVIAKNTFREVIRDRILYSLVVFALLLVLLSLGLVQLSFDENIRLSANFGFTGIHISAMALAVFIGSTLVAKEIEKQTILTLLARPISRAQFIMGKALGLMAVVNVVVLSLGLILSIFLFFLNFNFQFEFLIALIGILFEAAILLSVALFFGSFARPIMTVVFTVAVFLLGHWVESLGYFIKRSESELFKITATAVQYLIPDLERMNWRSAPVYAVTVPLDEVVKAAGWTLGWIMFLVAAWCYFPHGYRDCATWLPPDFITYCNKPRLRTLVQSQAYFKDSHHGGYDHRQAGRPSKR